ncbi:hypothetical protein [Nostoc sp. PCC 7107]|uniref:hypothetical protein n=1 Tax=Nostoc sp. PCC 7107 TaxID=317936 RepID=UPI00029F0515|nr:hypothetical protein [Nostoc sp. PCC 7107]AFY45727.1 hypothetical protein Nos7107_5220 [Nostoc sp. PCC 7107]
MSDKHIILDPTALYDIPSGYIPITTEVEWIEFFGVSNACCWVKGERLCEWAKTWLRVWNRSEEIAEIKQHPRSKLTQLFDNVPLPKDWSDERLLIVATKLDAYPQDNPIAHFLADNIPDSNRQIWFAEPSISHLAAWLAIIVPLEYQPFERVWQQQFRDFQRIKYTINKNDNHYERERAVADGNCSLPPKYMQDKCLYSKIQERSEQNGYCREKPLFNF